MKLDDKVKEFNVEIARLKALIPGLDCLDGMMVHRSQPHMLIGYVDSGGDTFAVEWTLEKPQVIASRLLDGHIELMNRLYENVLALEKITGEQKWIPKPPKS